MQYKPNYPNMDKLFPQHKIPKIESPTYEKDKSPYELLESQSAYLEKTSKENFTTWLNLLNLKLIPPKKLQKVPKRKLN